MKGYRKTAVILTLGLAVLTILSCLGYSPQGPFDARDFTRIAGIRVEMNPWEAIFEPLAAPFLILAGAPDFRTAGISTLIWVILVAAVWGVIAASRTNGGKKPSRIVLKGIRSVIVVSSIFILTILLFVVARVPCWRLVVDDPDLIVADFHSHTTKSADALVSLQTNLEWHAACGYNVVGLTEHNQFFAHESQVAGDSYFERLPGFVSGVEAHTGPQAMVVGICRDPRIQLEKQSLDEWPERTAWFSKRIHEECGGAVIALALKRLQPGRVSQLADAGVDGFEIANSGHPELRPELRQEALEASRSRGLVLVATTDWHGWTGLTRAWTVIRAPGASVLSRRQRADLAILKLREHNNSDIIPVIAGYIGDPSPVRAIFSPIAEAVRYAQELSPARVISWWIWTWAVYVTWVFLRRKGLPAGDILLDSVVVITGLGLVAAGFSLVREGTVTAASYPIHVGLSAVAAGAAVCACATFQGVRSLKRRRGWPVAAD